MKLMLAAMALCLTASAPALAEDAGHCVKTAHAGAEYVVCRFDPRKSEIRLFLNDEKGEPYGHFDLLKGVLAAKGETLLFAMNAGMYHQDRRPVGLYIEDGAETAALNMNDGPGNFHLKPNGVFFVTDTGAAGVLETQRFAERFPPPFTGEQDIAYATQSGPMLVIDGKIHPRFLPASDSLKRRNGVGVTKDGEVIFVLSDAPVRFHDFAAFFRDGLGAANALYLDGTISRVYAPELGRNDPGAAMGPIAGVVAKKD